MINENIVEVYKRYYTFLMANTDNKGEVMIAAANMTQAHFFKEGITNLRHEIVTSIPAQTNLEYKIEKLTHPIKDLSNDIRVIKDHFYEVIDVLKKINKKPR